MGKKFKCKSIEVINSEDNTLKNIDGYTSIHAKSIGASYSCDQPYHPRRNNYRGINLVVNLSPLDCDEDEGKITLAANKCVGKVVSKITNGFKKQGIVESYDAENEWFKVVYPNRDWDYVCRQDLPNVTAPLEISEAFLNGLKVAMQHKNHGRSSAAPHVRRACIAHAVNDSTGGGARGRKRRACIAHAGSDHSTGGARGRKRERPTASRNPPVAAKARKERKNAEDPETYVPLALREKETKRNEYYWNWC